MDNSNLFTYSCSSPKFLRKDKPESWVTVSNAPEKMFLSYPFFSEIPITGKNDPIRYGDFVIDIDSQELACESALKIINFFGDVYGLQGSFSIFLSGKKGVHLELSAEICGTSSGHRLLPLAYKRLAKDIEGVLQVKLDLSMYNRGTGKPWRQPNIMRECGTCKRQVSLDDLSEIFTKEEYTEACSGPGPLWAPESTNKNEWLADKLEYYLQEAEENQKILENQQPLSPDEIDRLAISMPDCIKFLSTITSPLGTSSTYNDVAIQLTAYAVSSQRSEADLFRGCETFIYGYPSTSLNNSEKRAENISARFRTMAANGYGFSCGAIKALRFPGFECSGCPFNSGLEISSEIKILSREELSNDNLSLIISESISDPGGLISTGMQALRDSGCPDIAHYNLPVVLSTIARAISGKITLYGYWPNLYMLKIGPNNGGKSASDAAIKKQLYDRAQGFYGPSNIASGPALLRSLAERGDNPTMLVVIDEMTSWFRSTQKFDPINDGRKDTLMELFSLTGDIYDKPYADAKKSIVIKNPCVSVTGNATPKIYDSFSEEDFETGMMQRIDVWANSKKLRRSKKPIKKQVDIDFFINPIIELFQAKQQTNDLSSYFSVPAPLDVTAGAEKFIENWSYQVQDDDFEAETDAIGGVLGRRYEASMKYAMIHHASKNGHSGLFEPLHEDSIQWGSEVADMLAQWKINVLLKNITTGDFHKSCRVFKDAIKAAMQRKRRPTFRTLLNCRPTLKDWQPEHSRRVIEVLQKRGEIALDDSKRKTAYFLSEDQGGDED